jgi:hypothetical protein
MEKKISYINRTYSDYKEALIEMSEKYYPDLSTSFNDASIAAWQIDVAADIADNLSYHIDRVFQETNIDSAKERKSLYAMARNCGFKIPGPKGAMAEVRFSIILPISNNEPNYNYAPIIKKGTRVSAVGQEFELLSDVDFAEQFDENGVSNRWFTPNLNSNGIATGYTVSKLAVVTAGETRVYRQVVRSSDIHPFMEIVLPFENVMSIESIIVVDGNPSVTNTPSYGNFYNENCSGVTRFHEVDNLAQNWCWGDKIGDNGKALTYKYAYTESSTQTDGNTTQTGGNSNNVVYSVTKGEWKNVANKFITEYTDKGYLKIIFGAGIEGDNITLDATASSFSKWQISRIMNNNNLGTLPTPNSTIFILYRIGGGKSSNVAKGAINKISYLNADFRNDASVIINTLKVENTTPSVSGKDMPSENELKYLIKYHNAAQNRCVTIKDYIDRILMLPPKYGTPFRVGVMEENNKIMVYLLGIDHNGHLDTFLPMTLVKNMEEYLSGYRCINDYVEIKSGRIINLSFDVDVIVDKNYNKVDVIKSIIDTITAYMDINKHFMGEEIYIGDLQKEISKIDGLINLISLKVYNNVDGGGMYSRTTISQETIIGDEYNDAGTSEKRLIDLDATDGILYNDGDTMMELKYPSRDIKIRIKER